MKDEVRQLKNQIEAELPSAFVEADNVRAPQGWPTGIEDVDTYLLWKGIPKASLSLFLGKLGQGSTSAWIEAAMEVISQGKWAAWVSGEAQLFPVPLKQKNLDLSRLLVVEAPPQKAPQAKTKQTDEKVLWLLQELMSSTIFDLIGCDLGEMTLREHQLQKLKTQARAVQTSLVLLSQNPRSRRSSLYSLILNFKKSEILIERALHRPTPQSISRRLSYAQFTLHTANRIDIGIRSKSVKDSRESNALLDPATLKQDS